MPRIRLITADEAHPLRRSVLRADMPDADVHFPQDDDPASFHIGVEVQAVLVGVGTLTPAGSPYRPDAVAWQLRGMAIDTAEQGRGHGALLVAEAVKRCAAAGASVLWCNARDSASGFYARLGFVTCGNGFTTTVTGLPHHVMVLDL